ncbi:hypothetical protein ACS25B_14400 [Dickeya dadantii subsp. dieffenbachiae]|uniref:hypothetical protein n=1 Tax=Dickeya dadantii TaxID=204038 RepID=UPI001267C0C3|nr:hypothetical protein [Dickeya dadantii]
MLSALPHVGTTSKKMLLTLHQNKLKTKYCKIRILIPRNNGKHHKEAMAGRYTLSARKTSCGENRLSVSRENGKRQYGGEVWSGMPVSRLST